MTKHIPFHINLHHSGLLWPDFERSTILKTLCCRMLRGVWSKVCSFIMCSCSCGRSRCTWVSHDKAPVPLPGVRRTKKNEERGLNRFSVFDRRKTSPQVFSLDFPLRLGKGKKSLQALFQHLFGDPGISCSAFDCSYLGNVNCSHLQPRFVPGTLRGFMPRGEKQLARCRGSNVGSHGARH